MPKDNIPNEVLVYLIDGNDPGDMAQLYWDKLTKQEKADLVKEAYEYTGI